MKEGDADPKASAEAPKQVAAEKTAETIDVKATEKKDA